MMQHIPVFSVLIPLLAAPICLLLGRQKLCWIFSTLVSWVALYNAVLILDQVLASGAVRYFIGGWEPPWGIEIRIDTASALVLLIVTAISSIVMPYAGESIAKEVKPHLQPLYYTAHLLCLAGLCGILVTGDAFNLFVFLEISSLSTYTMVSLSSDRRCLTAAYQYLVMGTIGATFILIGVGLLYMKTGTLNMLDLANLIAEHGFSRTIKTGLAFILVGVSLKLALFPLHLWMPGAYTHAPSAVSAFLAATATKVAVYVMMRFIFTIFGKDYVFDEMGMDNILMVLAVVAIFNGSIMAIFQHNAKTLLAYSSVAQIGYIVLGISFSSAMGLTSSLLHVFNHALMKASLFMALGAIFYRIGSVKIDDFRGLGKQMPWTMAAFSLGGLSLIGVPLTAGFVSKWYLVSASLQQGNWIVAALILGGSLLALVYVGRVIEVAYFKPADSDKVEVKEAPVGFLIPMWVVTLANLYFGIDTRLPVISATSAAELLFQGASHIGVMP
jgi:multicomponent Na+:H+ antiporter subunit D